MKLTTQYQLRHYAMGVAAAKEGRTHCPFRRNNIAWKCWTQGNWDQRVKSGQAL